MVADILFQDQFEFEKDVSQIHVVVEAAERAGMDGDVVREYLEGDGGKEEIEMTERKVRERGVKGVPCFCIGVGGRVGEQVVDGAGEIEEIFEALVRAQPRDSV
jgi:predicted DsbA family dithiol-disulfide isomerase